jgi:hypothetical protein
VELHDWSGRRADRELTDLRKRLRAASNPLTAVFIYNTDEFDLACDLAENQLDYDEHRAAYEAIVTRYYGSPGLVELPEDRELAPPDTRTDAPRHERTRRTGTAVAPAR